MLRAGTSGLRVLRPSTHIARHPPCLCSLLHVPSQPLRSTFQREIPSHIEKKVENDSAEKNGDKKISKNSAADKNRKQRNEDIPHKMVRVVDPETSVLRPLAPLRSVLAELDSERWSRKQYELVLVASEPEPIVKFVNKAEAYRKSKEQKQRARDVVKSNGEMEIQLTWDVAGGDHQRKIDQAREGLLEGQRVNMVFAPKKGVRHWVSPEQMVARAQETVEKLADVGKEWKARDVGRLITVIHLEGPHYQAVTEKEIKLAWGASEDVLRQKVKEAREALAQDQRVRISFASEKELAMPLPRKKKTKGPKDREEEAKAASKVFLTIPSGPSETPVRPKVVEEKKWTRKEKETQVQEMFDKLAAVAKEWKPRDDWKSSTTLYLERIHTE